MTDLRRKLLLAVHGWTASFPHDSEASRRSRVEEALIDMGAEIKRVWVPPFGSIGYLGPLAVLLWSDDYDVQINHTFVVFPEELAMKILVLGEFPP